MLKMLDGCIPWVSHAFVQYLVQNKLPMYADDHHVFYNLGGNIIAVTMSEVMEHYEEIDYTDVRPPDSCDHTRPL